ncbi:unnamed protein product [Miscanthus lutarioriparius]|uniref:non-specific serine/threonine protein kinase n=1 Tax=Miscanthus lutarioriparius TaxID=422564 RepID=A0A811Q069_9POAL|nr:unnamed protein product [Miscanthus lutarioriparius]
MTHDPASFPDRRLRVNSIVFFLLDLFSVFACPCALSSSYLCRSQLQLLSGRFLAHLRRGFIIFQSPPEYATASCHIAPPRRGGSEDGGAGADCGIGISRDCLALGSYYITRGQNLSYISSLFGINDYLTLAPYTTQDDSRINVYFSCRCLALPSAPFSTYLAGSFPYRVSQGGESYASVAAKFHNLTTATLLQPAPSSVNDVLDAGTVVNLDVSPDYKLLLTNPLLGDGETPDSVAASHGLSSQAEVDLFRRYMHFHSSTGVIAGTSVSGAGVILALFFLWYKKYYGMLPRQNWSRNAPRIESFLQKQGTSHPKRYSYQDVRRMTKSFAHKLGQGGYGAVYRGNLADGRFCLQGRKRALIYEYMPNGLLERYTFGSMSAEGDNSLCWDKPFEIVIRIGRGLEYLHNGCNTRIVHFDIKPQNILLDQNFCPKISDFGLAKLCQQKQSKISMVGMRGTIGYIAPEVFNRSYGAVSNKSDVYSYGMMVLEMVGARKQIDVGIDTSSNYFPHWLYDKLDQFCGATISEIGSDTKELVRKMAMLACGVSS